ncbi:MAG: Y-family DNA polymerase [Tannerella sp.]|jgi:DNA polymerase V|nr:Y-family DNA polymerase [Tannerella sp.]
MFGLIDCNNFYASCERRFQPRLAGKAIIVLSLNDGCIIARSDEAKLLGIKMGEPFYKYAGFCRRNGVAVFSSNYELYTDMSHRVMTALEEFIDNVMVYSIDEAFLDFSGYEHFGLKEYGEGIVRKISRLVPVSLGIAPTRTLAKIAGKYAKKFKGYKSCCVMDTDEKRLKALAGFAVGDVWGIGRQYAKKLEARNIKTALDLAKAPGAWVRGQLTVQGERIWLELNGEPAIDPENMDVPRKSICTSRSFGETTDSREDLREAVSGFAASCARKLRKQKSCAGAVFVFIHTNVFNESAKQYTNGKIIRLPVASNITNELTGYALRALDAIYRPGYMYKKAGVILEDIMPETAVQRNFFDEYPRDKFGALMPVIDSLNGGFNRSHLQLAVETGTGRWQMKQELRSGRFTTNIDEVIRIKV